MIELKPGWFDRQVDITLKEEILRKDFEKRVAQLYKTKEIQEVWPLPLLRVLAWNDCHSSFHYWVPEKYGSVKVGIECSDWFYWGCAEAQEITEEDLQNLIQAIADVVVLHNFEFYGPLLWVCRKRKMRPMREAYKDMPEELHELFNSTGPQRESW